MIFCICEISLFIAGVCFPANDYIFCPGPFLRGNHVHPCGPWYRSESYTTVDFFSLFLPIFTFCSSFCQVIASSPQSPGRGVTPPCLLRPHFHKKRGGKLKIERFIFLKKELLSWLKAELSWYRLEVYP